jgi:hypothetical protein
VTQHELAAAGPIREYYLVGPSDTPDDSLWRTEIGWPIFQTRPGHKHLRHTWDGTESGSS